jgi:predicted RNA-binding protein with PIN domain
MDDATLPPASPEGRGDPASPRWLVDGMNLIGSRPNRWWNDPDRAIRELIEELDRYAGATGEEVAVVFDRRPRDLAPGVHGNARVAFASRGGRNAADHEIVDIVSGDGAREMLGVVTSDRELVGRVRKLGAGVLSSMAFRRRMDSALGQAERAEGGRGAPRTGRAVKRRGPGRATS